MVFFFVGTCVRNYPNDLKTQRGIFFTQGWPVVKEFSARIYIAPQPHMRPRFSKGIVYTPKEQRVYQKHLQSLLLEKKPKLMSGPLQLELIFAVKRPKTVKRLYPEIKPDLDNFIKNFADSANGILYKDDAQVCAISCVKIYAENSPYIQVSLKPLD